MNLLQVVALTDDIPEKGLKRGQVGTIVEQLAADVFEIEFADLDGKPYAFAAISKPGRVCKRAFRLRTRRSSIPHTSILQFWSG